MAYYEITIKGHIADYWSSTFGGLIIARLPNGKTKLSGEVIDQPQLHGLLSRIRDMGLTLIELKQQAKE